MAASRAQGADGATWWPWSCRNLYHQAGPAVLRDPAAPRASRCLWACDQDPEGPMILWGQLPGISCGPEGAAFSRNRLRNPLGQQHQILCCARPAPALTSVRTPSRPGRGEACTCTHTRACTPPTRTRMHVCTHRVLTTDAEFSAVKTWKAAILTPEYTWDLTVYKGKTGTPQGS